MKRNDVSKLFEIVSILTNVIWNVVHADGVNIGQSNGKAASQDIFHVHVHVIPRFKNDTGDNFWPSRKNFTTDELTDISIKIKNQLKKDNIKFM
jgi:histidine triad (HIT) family protein